MLLGILRILDWAIRMKIGVVIPSYKVSRHILDVIAGVSPEVSKIYIVDDACPEGSGKLVEALCRDKRVEIITHSINQGVGGAVLTGYAKGLSDGMDIMVKIDGDGQMDPTLLPSIIAPIVSGRADYSKGNRFDTLESLEQMPKIRIFGNAVLSLMSKISTGYWNITDPTNGYTAIHRTILSQLPMAKVHKRFFFESDMLYRLAVMRAVVWDVPIEANYGDEISNLKIGKVLWEFPRRHFANHLKRIFYAYYLRELNIASFELPLGLLMIGFGAVTGLLRLSQSVLGAQAASAGTVMLSAVPIILGFQLLLAFLSYDIGSTPKIPRTSQRIPN